MLHNRTTIWGMGQKARDQQAHTKLQLCVSDCSNFRPLESCRTKKVERYPGSIYRCSVLCIFNFLVFPMSFRRRGGARVRHRGCIHLYSCISPLSAHYMTDMPCSILRARGSKATQATCTLCTHCTSSMLHARPPFLQFPP
ncbi:hypothetical protein P280DRAFT_171191 [Massarina eburnea CBS 473.64]|uniref:Uncharacterized protein n=1 Tax=Massarina eburnea CBS 473.64 TaxID=1395130 RepID=A0A6A6SA16_9PLEO|nr:hypothetical protein P280DRAFT_171191 [Massarina eburnea CBS 473.64]